MRRGVALVLLMVAAAACSSQQSPENTDGTWVGTLTTEGNVTTVVNESGSVWRGTARLVEEASIGVEAGADEYMLGQPSSVYASDERILVADSQAPVVRTYDFAGRFTGNLGGPGQGPGEYRLPEIVGALPDGRLFVLDLSGRRLNLYSATGEPIDTWPATDAHCCVMRFLGGRGDSIWGVRRDSSLGFIRTDLTP